ncbi:hypothetical protein [Arenibacter sp. 6A1]|uniref:hypothetical protein n=1 Tax=Arenibacter sp. 6A1 TaxID=2720391 RepID=UPI00197B2FE9|nr:hypothetical protein [Arenibacter sp. 6A1]
MKTLKYIFGISLMVLFFFNCTRDDSIDFLDTVVPPSNISALFAISQDNSGTVTITPNGEGAVSFDIYFGDETTEPANTKPGGNISHTYAEGSYSVKIVGKGLTGLKTEVTQDLVVSFKAPENLVATISNDAAVSKKVNVTATAEYATSFDVYFGEEGADEPVSANIGETASFIYREPGTYTVKVVAKGGAIATTEYTEEFLVTEIVQPIASAPKPPRRASQDVISIFSSVYSDETGADYFPDWGQGGQGSSWATFDLEGDAMLQYINLSYQGIQFGAAVDVSAMEYIHMDVWTSDVTRIETSLISVSNGEKPVWTDLTAGQWTSINIPISSFTDQGLTVADIHQLKFVGEPWASGTVFIDNIYFYRASTGGESSVTPITFEVPYTLSSFDGGDMAIITNPDTNGNTSGMVAQLVKGAGQPWAGSKITVPTPFSFINETTVTLKVWSPRAGLNLLMKFEDDTPWPNTVASAEVTATTTASGQWEELSFDFSGISTEVDFYNLVLIMDNGTVGDGSENFTVFVDDISVESFLDFEPQQALSSFDGGDISIIANPDTNGNTSEMVAQMVKGAGQPWTGSKITVPEPFSFSSSTSVTVKVWSPRVGLNLLMKFEDATPWPNTIASAEVTATTTVSGQWEELTFDFSGISTSVDFTNLVLIMDNGTVGDGSANFTIYIDDIEQK